MAQQKRPLTIAQSVAAEIRERILSREIAGGEPLRQDAIAKSFGTSIIPVREALRQLEAEGLVELQARRGAVATELTLGKALEWIHLRRLIESDLIGLAKRSCRPVDGCSRAVRSSSSCRSGPGSTMRWTIARTSRTGANTTGSFIPRSTRPQTGPKP